MKYSKNTLNSSALSSLIAGAGIGVYGTGSFIITNVICPACIIVTPVLLGYGFYQYKKGENKKV